MTAKAEMEELLGNALHLARGDVEEQGGFSPFALEAAGEERRIRAVDPDHPEGGRVTPEQMVDHLRRMLREAAAAGEVQACAIAYDVRLERDGGELTDAIAIEVHGEGEPAVLATMPYVPGDSATEWDELAFGPADALVFPAAAEGEPA